MGRVKWSWAWVLLPLLAWGAVVAFGSGTERDATEQLASFLGERRWSQGRSALDLPYRPYDPEERLTEDMALLASLRAAEGRDDARLSLALAQLYLWRGGTGDLERAAKALAGEAPSAAALNERALVLHAENQPLQALETIERALELSALPAVLFNRALILQELSLAIQAEAAWGAFLEVEPTGGWAEEARRHLAEVRAKLAGAGGEPASSGNLYLAFQQLRRAADLASLKEDAQLQQALATQREQGVRIFDRELEYLHSLDAEGWSRYRSSSARYAELRKRVLAGNVERGTLRRFLDAEVDPLLQVRASHLAFYDAMQRTDAAATHRYARRLLDLCGEYGCEDQHILVASDLGTLAQREGDFQGAEAAFHRALEAIGDRDPMRRSELLDKLALTASLLGQNELASGLLVEATTLSLRAGHELSRSVALLNLSAVARARDLPRTTVALYREAREAARRAGVGRIEVKAGVTLARAYRELGRHAEAEHTLRAAEAALRKIDIPDVHLMYRLAEVELRLGLGRAGEAIPLARQVAEEAASVGIAGRRLEALHLLARAEAEADPAAAVRTRTTLLELFEEMAANAPSALATQRVQAQAAANRVHLAFLLHDSEGDAAAGLRSLGATPRPLGPDECLAAYAVLEGRVGIWFRVGVSTSVDVVEAETAAAAGSPIGPGRCPETTRRLTLVDLPSTEASSISRLVRERHPELAVVLAEDAARPWPEETVAGPALAVHSPEPVPLRLGLSFLQHAPAEAAIVEQSFSAADVLQRRAATPAGVKAVAGRYGVLHFAVHGESRLDTGAASFLVLGGEQGKLQVADILSMDLVASRPLVVLSACRSGGRSHDGEQDGAGLAWAFLEAGAGAVIANLDPVRDEVALDFSRAFYGELTAGSGVSAAFEAAVAAVRASHGDEAAVSFVLTI